MLKKIIETTKYVSDNSKYVSINERKLDEFVKSIDGVNPKHWLSGSPFGLLDLNIETIVNFLLIYEAIDFSFWGEPKWTVSTDSGMEDGSIALLYVLLKYVKEKNTTDFSNITKEEFSDILKGNIEIPLFNERYRIIKNVSKIVNENMDGNFYKYIKSIKEDNELFKTIINHFPNFKDERKYNGKTVYIYKLAQLLTSDILHIRNVKENIKVNYSNLIGCSDYKIPQVLRGLGILEYSIELSNIVDNKQEIKENSDYETEIRANTLVVIDKIKNKLGNKICSIDINDYIWGKSKNKDIKLKPYHLTRCINY